MKNVVIRWRVLSDLVKSHGWTRGAELGIWKGQTLFHLLDTCPDLSMIGVDCWPTTETVHTKDMERGISTWYPPDEIHGHRAKVLERAKQYDGRLVIYESDTVEASTKVDTGTLDFCFVDADHSEHGVLRDVEAWRPKIRPGGYLLGHDRQWPAVMRALKQAFPQGWESHADHIWGVPIA